MSPNKKNRKIEISPVDICSNDTNSKKIRLKCFKKNRKNHGCSQHMCVQTIEKNQIQIQIVQ